MISAYTALLSSRAQKATVLVMVDLQLPQKVPTLRTQLLSPGSSYPNIEVLHPDMDFGSVYVMIFG